VDRTGLVVRRLLDHGSRLDHQHLALHQAGGDGVSSTREDTGVGLSRHGHPLGGSVLIETFEVGEPDGLELIDPDTDGLGFPCGASNGPEAAPLQLAANATWNDRARHVCEHMLITASSQPGVSHPQAYRAGPARVAEW
jgi:hypothetical protein